MDWWELDNRECATGRRHVGDQLTPIYWTVSAYEEGDWYLFVSHLELETEGRAKDASAAKLAAEEALRARGLID